MIYPGYRAGLENGTLHQIADTLMAELEDCTICPHHCHVNRRAGELGIAMADGRRRLAVTARILAKNHRLSANTVQVLFFSVTAI